MCPHRIRASRITFTVTIDDQSTGGAVTFIEHIKSKVGDLADTVNDAVVARGEKGESDVASDRHVAGSRAGEDGEDGHYVGRSGPDIDSDVAQSGAEARSEQTRRSR